MPLRRARARLLLSLGRPIAPHGLVAFRILFGLLMAFATARFLAHGWVDEHTQAARVFFHYAGFEWVRPLPSPWMHALYALMGLLALAVAAGLFTRASAALFAAAFLYAHHVDKTYYLNHYYLVVLLAALVALMPLGRRASVDVWRRPALRLERFPAWPLHALRAQLGVVYLFGGVAKLKSDWLLHAQPMKIWLAANPDFPILGPLFEQTWVAFAFSWAGAVFDLSVVPLLLWRRSRPFAYAAVLVFHLVTARLFSLGMFPYLMIGLTTVFFAPDWPLRLAGRLRASAGRPPVAPPPRPTTAPSAPSRALVALLAVHFALQLALPLRHLLYPGDVLWTEEGFRYAWHVMLMEKNGSAEFIAREPSTGRTFRVNPRGALSDQQARMMATQPDFLLEFAHVVAADLRARGVRDPEVRVDAFASLNGRPLQRLVDPSVDLARERDGLGAKRWIVPLAETPPP